MRRILTALGLVVVAVMMIAAYPNIQVEDGRIHVTDGKIQFWSSISNLVAHWKLNEDAANTDVEDAKGSNGGTLSGGNTADKSITGKINKALDFDGIGDYVTLDNVLTIGSSDNTITAWVKPINSASRIGVILGNYAGDATKQSNWEIYSNGKLRVYWNMGAPDLSGTADVADGTWHHVAVVRNKTDDKFYFYVDGESDAISSGVNTAGDDVTFTTVHKIGADQAADHAHFQGAIDDLRIYDRALTGSEILEIYNRGNGTEQE